MADKPQAATPPKLPPPPPPQPNPRLITYIERGQGARPRKER
jgi:hypothetical protein